MADKIYAKGIYIKTRETSFGDVLKVSIKLEDFGAFVKANKNDKGYINFDILKRKEPSDKGETHYVVLDTWKPEKQGDGAASKPAKKKQETSDESNAFGDDDVPFA